ncbi:MAG: SurA N-terminal domain-containing protein [Christensenellales bacterium]
MKKLAVTLLLVLSLILSGCSLVVKDPAVDAKQVIIQVNGEQVDKQAFTSTYNALMNQEYQMQQMYQMYGMQAPEIVPEDVMASAKDQQIRAMIIRQKAKELGLDVLTPEEETAYAAQVETEYQGTLDQVKQYYFADTTLEGEALTSAIQAKADELGITRALTEAAVRERFISDKLEKDTTKDVTVPDEDVKADYDAKVAANKTAYEADINAYGTAVNGGQTVYFAPEGYRMVKQVLIKFLAEDQTKIDALKAEQSTAATALTAATGAVSDNAAALAAEGLAEADKKALQDKVAGLEAAVAEAQAKADKVAQDLLAAQNAGYEAILPKAQDVFNQSKTLPFDDLVKQFNEDTGMPAAGYAVRKGFTSFDEAFVVPAMALETIGAVAEPSQGAYGYYIVQYAADVTPGPVAYDSVKTALHDALLETKKTDTWEAEITKWTEAAKIETWLDRMAD